MSVAGISLKWPFQDKGLVPVTFSGGNARSSMPSSTMPAASAGANSKLSGRWKQGCGTGWPCIARPTCVKGVT